MKEAENYTEKLNKMLLTLPIDQLEDQDSSYIREMALLYTFTFQELKKIINFSIDFKMWQEGSIKVFNTDTSQITNIKQLKKKIFSALEKTWTDLKHSKKSYASFSQTTKSSPNKINNLDFKPSNKNDEVTILGKCPVASEKTLCCNLQTLDVVDNCGFECSYCSIQSFFPNNTIFYEDKLSEKLKRLVIDPEKIYHIGTGQSSDSMLWGNKSGVLDELIKFAKDHPNVILEMKTKSKNISYFLNNEIPKNVICTWSLNPDTIIENEEHHTASLNERIQSANKLAAKGILVGFHLHPIIYYDSYEKDYQNLANKLISIFKPEEVALVSMGTLTFTKPVLKEIRKKKIYSKILQMPLVQASGKFSYPDHIKVEIFKSVYESFKSWHDKTFFYLCMENIEYWPQVFGYSYKDNHEFEINMKKSYMGKIKQFN